MSAGTYACDSSDPCEDREGGDERRALRGRDDVKPYRRRNQPESETRDTGHYGTDKRGEEEEN